MQNPHLNKPTRIGFGLLKCAFEEEGEEDEKSWAQNKSGGPDRQVAPGSRTGRLSAVAVLDELSASIPLQCNGP